MSWKYVGLGMIMWFVALFAYITGELYKIDVADAYTGVFILLGFGYFLLSTLDDG